MIKRIVAYGCSHAYGSEMAGRGDSTGRKENIWGARIAKHYDLPFVNHGRPGNSSKVVLHQVLEHCQPGDLCIFSGIQMRRDMYIPTKDDDIVGPANITMWEVGKVLEHMVNHTDKKFKLATWFPWNHIVNKQTKDFKEFNIGKRFVEYANLKTNQIISEYYAMYAWELAPMFVDWLTTYASYNAIAKSKGAYPVNFMFDQSVKLTDLTLNYPHETNIYTKAPTLSEPLDAQMPKKLIDGQLYKEWRNDPTRICKGEYALMQWVLKEQGLSVDQYPDNRMGHCGIGQQQPIADEIIKKIDELYDV